MLVIYSCYDEKRFGPIEEALKISNDEYLIWDHPRMLRKNLKYPTEIIIKIIGKERYFRGNLLLVMEWSAINPHILSEDRKHRPSKWTTHEPFRKSVFFISNLKEVDEPEEIKGKHRSRGQMYFNF